MVNTLDLDKRISMAEVKRSLLSDSGNYDSRVASTIAALLGDELSPREFYHGMLDIFEKMQNGSGSGIPVEVSVYAGTHEDSIITDYCIGVARDYCPPAFAKAVGIVHRETFRE